jgi:D-alanyl-D-alanine carboxypeptidase/D-alanyl-D-alanine-endopeptidase (penicillin-binding protein 4)
MMASKLPLGLVAIVLLTLPGKTLAATSAAGICPAALPDRIQQIIEQGQFGQAHWGILVQTLERQVNQRRTLVDRDSQKLFTPASNAKLLTTAAALQRLGSRYRIRTSIFGAPSTSGGWQLQVVGRGDPSLKDPQLEQLAQQLKRRGIIHVQQLVLDDRYFGSDPVNPSWEWGDLQSGYGSIANSLIVNLNYHSLTVTPQQVGQPLKLSWNDPNAIAGWQIINQTRTVSQDASEFLQISRDLGQPILRIHGQLREGGEPDVLDLATLNPQQVFRDRLLQALQAANITVDQVLFATADTGQLSQEVAFVESAPLAELVQVTNTESDNLYAEALLQTIGATASHDHFTTTTAAKITPVEVTAEDSGTTAGLKVLAQTLEQIGVDRSGYQLTDGSGLARMNLVSPMAFVQTLQAMFYQPNGMAYRASLPIAGKTGTLANRLQATSTIGIVQAKTGTLTGVAGLSGYISPKAYQPLAFSILLNHSLQPNAEQRSAIDQIVLLLAQLKRC